jgi:hypothetical protein
MLVEYFVDYGDAIEAALAWLRERKITQLDEPFESRLGGFGMRTRDQSAGYRIEFDSRSGAHINVWCGHEKGPHYVFPGNENAVRAKYRQLYWWDPNLVRR